MISPDSPAGLDLDAIEQLAQYVHATASGKPYALAEDARLLVAEVQRLQAGDQAIRNLHGRESEDTWCNFCGENWPCMTIRALAAGGVL